MHSAIQDWDNKEMSYFHHPDEQFLLDMKSDRLHISY